MHSDDGALLYILLLLDVSSFYLFIFFVFPCVVKNIQAFFVFLLAIFFVGCYIFYECKSNYTNVASCLRLTTKLFMDYKHIHSWLKSVIYLFISFFLFLVALLQYFSTCMCRTMAKVREKKNRKTFNVFMYLYCVCWILVDFCKKKEKGKEQKYSGCISEIRVVARAALNAIDQMPNDAKSFSNSRVRLFR